MAGRVTNMRDIDREYEHLEEIRRNEYWLGFATGFGTGALVMFSVALLIGFYL